MFTSILLMSLINVILATSLPNAPITEDELRTIQKKIVEQRTRTYNNETEYALDLSLEDYEQIIVNGFGKIDELNARRVANLCETLDSRKKAAEVYFTFRNRKLFESVTPLVLNKKFLKIDPQRIAVARELCNFLHNLEWYKSGSRLMQTSISEMIESRAARHSIPYMRDYCTAFNNRAGIKSELSKYTEASDEQLQDYLKFRSDMTENDNYFGDIATIYDICQFLNVTPSNEELSKGIGNNLTVQQLDELALTSPTVTIGFVSYSLGICSAAYPPAEGMELVANPNAFNGPHQSDIIQLSLEGLNGTFAERISANIRICPFIAESRPVVPHEADQ